VWQRWACPFGLLGKLLRAAALFLQHLAEVAVFARVASRSKTRYLMLKPQVVQAFLEAADRLLEALVALAVSSASFSSLLPL